MRFIVGVALSVCMLVPSRSQELIAIQLPSVWTSVDVPIDATGAQASNVEIRLSSVSGDVIIASKYASEVPISEDDRSDLARVALKNWWSPVDASRAKLIHELELKQRIRISKTSPNGVKLHVWIDQPVTLAKHVLVIGEQSYRITSLTLEVSGEQFVYQYISSRRYCFAALLPLSREAICAVVNPGADNKP